MRPDVYPRTLENIKAVLLFYFPRISHTEIDVNAERVYDQRKFKDTMYYLKKKFVGEVHQEEKN